MVTPTVISTFCGTGGSSLGYKWAGYKELLAVDFDKHAIECFKLNFPDVPIWHKSIIDITGQEILKFCNLKRGELDVLDGSPPCQGFSTAGKRKVGDERNDLFREYVRIIHDLSPKIFVMENVTGMVKGTMKGRFIEIMETLKGLDYNVKCKQMNSMYYGVPQSRERLIFIGVRKDLNMVPIYPTPSKHITSVKEAWLNMPKQNTPELSNFLKNVVPKMKIGQNLNDIAGKGGFQVIRIYPNKPCPTIIKLIGGIGYASLIHPYENRVLSIDEIKRVCSFPDDWILTGRYALQKARLGNAVMPKFMQAISETLKTEILEKHYAGQG